MNWSVLTFLLPCCSIDSFNLESHVSRWSLSSDLACGVTMGWPRKSQILIPLVMKRGWLESHPSLVRWFSHSTSFIGDCSHMFHMIFPLKTWLPEGITMAARSRTIDSLTVSNGSQGWGSAGKVHCNGCGIVLVIISTLAILLSMWWRWWWCFVGVGVGVGAVAVAVVAAAYHHIPYYDILYYCYF